MKTLFTLLMVMPLMISCDKSYENPGGNNDIILSGSFVGTFHRTGGGTSNVSILFTDNSFEGQSDQPKYPAICHGTFSVDQSNDMVTFDDACSWTADFDWSLILDGEYQLISNPDKSLIMRRTNGNITDEYKIWRITR